MIRDLTVGQFLTFGLLTLALAALWLPERQRGREDGVSSRASRLWMGALGSIATHFGLNTPHYVFFTYPALASAVG